MILVGYTEILLEALEPFGFIIWWGGHRLGGDRNMIRDGAFYFFVHFFED